MCAVIGGIAGLYFGDYEARKLGLNQRRGFWSWRTHAYAIVRALVVIGGAILRRKECGYDIE